MSTLLTDTHPNVERIQIELMRKTPGWRKLEILGELNATVRTFALSGLRQRHPEASPELLRRLLADLILGEELAARVYGEHTHAG